MKNSEFNGLKFFWIGSLVIIVLALVACTITMVQKDDLLNRSDVPALIDEIKLEIPSKYCFASVADAFGDSETNRYMVGLGSSTLFQMSNYLHGLSGVPGYINLAQRGETSSQALVRLGINEIKLKEIGVNKSSTIVEASTNTNSLRHTVGKWRGAYGVMCNDKSNVTFTPFRDYQLLNSDDFSTFQPIQFPDVNGKYVIVSTGKNDINHGVDVSDVFKNIKLINDHVRTRGGEIIIIDNFSNSNWEGSSKRHSVSALNDKIYSLRDVKIVSINEFILSSDVWANINAYGDKVITPTSDDFKNQSLGLLPPSLTEDGSHLINQVIRAFVDQKLAPILRDAS